MSASPGRLGFVPGVVVGLIAGVILTPLGDQLLGGGDGDKLPRATEARELIEDRYYRESDDESLDDASVDGMIRSLRKDNEDRFSNYFDPKTYETFLSSTNGEFSGIGLTVSETKRGLRVSSVFDGTPAKRAGIEVGEVITAADGKSLAGVASQIAVAKIKGEPMTTVKLEIFNPTTKKTRNLKVERARVRIPAVAGEMLRAAGDKVAHVALVTFSRGAHAELRDEVERLDGKGAEALILDLRGNGGGLLDEAQLVASIFIEDGLIVSTSGRTRPDRELDAVGKALDARPMVVLVNGDTASSSEIVAAALDDYNIATVVGTRTFGKGVFQEVIELEDGGALDITVGEFFTPEGESLAGKGITPAIKAADDPKTPREDEALDRALEILAGEL